MSTFFDLMSRYFWLLCLVFGALNYRKALSSLAVPATGNQAHEAYSYVKRFAIGTNLPWAVMGVGYLTGYTPTGWYYLRPQDGNPFVLAWLATIVVTMLTYSYWVLFAGGAQKIVDYNLMSVLGQNNNGPHSLRSIKFFAVVATLFLPLWLYLMISTDAALPT